MSRITSEINKLQSEIVKLTELGEDFPQLRQSGELDLHSRITKMQGKVDKLRGRRSRLNFLRENT